MQYFYARVSTEKQNEARQLEAAAALGIPQQRIHVDKQSGKDFDRVQWVILNSKLHAGDVLFIKSIDRLGRNYAEIISVWGSLTKERGVDIVVLDMPLLDTRKDKNLLGTFIADIVLQILSFVAENERANIKQRQAEGIRAAKARGVKFGRPRVQTPRNFGWVAHDVLRGELTQSEGARLCNMKLSTFRLRVKDARKRILRSLK